LIRSWNGCRHSFRFGISRGRQVLDWLQLVLALTLRLGILGRLRPSESSAKYTK
jgi:hypothetical protein